MELSGRGDVESECLGFALIAGMGGVVLDLDTQLEEVPSLHFIVPSLHIVELAFHHRNGLASS